MEAENCGSVRPHRPTVSLLQYCTIDYRVEEYPSTL